MLQAWPAPHVDLVVMSPAIAATAPPLERLHHHPYLRNHDLQVDVCQLISSVALGFSDIYHALLGPETIKYIESFRSLVTLRASC